MKYYLFTFIWLLIFILTIFVGNYCLFLISEPSTIDVVLGLVFGIIYSLGLVFFSTFTFRTLS